MIHKNHHKQKLAVEIYLNKKYDFDKREFYSYDRILKKE